MNCDRCNEYKTIAARYGDWIFCEPCWNEFQNERNEMPNEDNHDLQSEVMKRGNYTIFPTELLEAVRKGFISCEEFGTVCEIFSKIPAFRKGKE